MSSRSSRSSRSSDLDLDNFASAATSASTTSKYSRRPANGNKRTNASTSGIDSSDLIDGMSPREEDGDRDSFTSSSSSSSSSTAHASAPSRLSSWVSSAIPGPPWVRNIIVTEACERYSYYGLRAVLTLYLTQALLFDKDTSVAIASYTSALAYFTPLLGGYVSDTFFGKYRTIIGFSLLYCVGSVVLATTAIGGGSIPGCFLGLILIGFGTGGIKPCVSAFGADQFAGPYAQGKHATEVEEEVTLYFHAFYFAINTGSVCSYIFTPLLRRYFGFSVAFGVPAIFLLIATFIVWIGRSRYYKQPPSGSVLVPIARVLRYAAFGAPEANASTPLLSGSSSASSSSSSSSSSLSSPLLESHESYDLSSSSSSSSSTTSASWVDRAASAPDVTEEDVYNTKCLLRVLPFFSIMPAFWMLFDQQSNAWILQAEQMERYGLEPEQLNLANPLFVMLLIPLFERYVYPWCEHRSVRFGVFRRVGLGMLLAALAFFLSAAVQARIDDDLQRLTNEAAQGGVHGGVQAVQAVHGVDGMYDAALAASLAWLSPNDDDLNSSSSSTGGGGSGGSGSDAPIEQSTVSVFLQLPQFLMLSCGEVLISITCLEFAYTQAPKSMKSLLSAVWLVTTAVGDLLCGVLYNALARQLSFTQLYVLFAGLMLVNYIVYLVAVVYRFDARPVPVPPSLRLREAAAIAEAEAEAEAARAEAGRGGRSRRDDERERERERDEL